MARANPKAWFTSPIAKITYKKVDKWARIYERSRPFFPTWKEVHDWMLRNAIDKVKRLERELVSARRHLDKVKMMTDPVQARPSDVKEG